MPERARAGRVQGALRRILHAADFSRASSAAFGKAIEMAKTSGADLTIVHVLTTSVMSAPDGYMSPRAYEQLQASARAFALKHLDALAARARKAGVHARTLLLVGVPHEQIVRAVRSTRADLLVIGTHGRTGLAKFFLGSVASRVIAIAPCPVLTVRGR